MSIPPVPPIEVYADLTCPFAHVGLHRFLAARRRRAQPDPRVIVRSWPLELVNGSPLTGAGVGPKVEVLRKTVAADLFAGFDPDRFPSSTLPALGLVVAAYSRSIAAGDALSLALRHALFEEGADLDAPGRMAEIARGVGLLDLVPDDDGVLRDWRGGVERGVLGSPHFFVGDRDFYCPALRITHDANGDLHIDPDPARFDDLVATAFA